ncbi:hypothetical protein [Dysgonomonas sp. 25]|uniref:DUF6913 domain-containing protein n=1 Tax=Dysgonomonas sp. 25 TaxID=2302933 RepID=UPI0013D2A08A|nr:hypothetical protein [Dysgonomonas sp. 25]NDV68516.1 hypothetical protein [Dysgonomonas sp. 25]
MFKYLQNKKLKSAIHKNDRQHVFLDFNSINNILILFENKNLDEVEHIVKDLSKSGKSVYLWTHNPDKKAVAPQRQSLPLQTITGRDVSAFGSISDELLSVFRNQQYDTVIDLTLNNEYPLQYLLANNKAVFSVGIRESEERLYDFVLLKNDEMNLKDTFTQIKFYLNNMWKGTNN